MQAWQEACLFLWMNIKSVTTLIEDGILSPSTSPTPPTLPIPPRTSMPERDLFGELSHMLWGLGLIFIILIALSWLSKRFLANRMAPIRAGGDIQILDRRTLSVKSTLYLVEIEGARWLVGEGPTGLTSFGRLDFPGSTMPKTSALPSAPPFPSHPIDKKEVDSL